MSIRVRQLFQWFKLLKDVENIDIKLIDDCIDKWSVKFLYPENKIVHLNFEFHLVENLPPKITVVFPSKIRYVCFEELGGVKWSSDNDLINLMYSLKNEYSDKCEVYNVQEILPDEKAEKHWQYVRRVHPDWEYVDITQLSSTIPQSDISNWRSEAKTLITSN